MTNTLRHPESCGVSGCLSFCPLGTTESCGVSSYLSFYHLGTTESCGVLEYLSYCEDKMTNSLRHHSFL
jgi:hypothetical protein